ncbi:MAG: hypothetical protein FP816_15045 [Desulfobacteraceae bacterium]|nr:hypothetical protein [Desulfobacteraceae bacterium]MBU4053057.1 hypothetical protein [Pseudomonadota bacterium]
MIQYFISRDLSEKLGINLARWKRWSREFLPPDPLGGKQSGYARQYSLSEAFMVFLGGHLVGNLSLSIPESKIILKAFGEWIKERNLFSGHDPGGEMFGNEGSSPGELGLVIFGGLNQQAYFFIQESEKQPFFCLDLTRGEGNPLNGASQPQLPASVNPGFGAGTNGRSVVTSAKILFINSIINEFKSRLNP